MNPRENGPNALVRHDGGGFATFRRLDDIRSNNRSPRWGVRTSSPRVLPSISFISRCFFWT